MRTYSVTVAWAHKGARYAKQQTVRVKATSLSAATGKGLRQVRSKHRGSIREVLGSEVEIRVQILNEVQTERGADHVESTEHRGVEGGG